MTSDNTVDTGHIDIKNTTSSRMMERGDDGLVILLNSSFGKQNFASYKC